MRTLRPSKCSSTGPLGDLIWEHLDSKFDEQMGHVARELLGDTCLLQQMGKHHGPSSFSFNLTAEWS